MYIKLFLLSHRRTSGFVAGGEIRRIPCFVSNGDFKRSDRLGSVTRLDDVIIGDSSLLEDSESVSYLSARRAKFYGPRISGGG